ncbi:MAG: hypothetical protein K2Q23_19850 [Bryobacteraceae bacterium]|nr:hypothetical protein [Bryobacteraceae bacterium]
MSLSPEIELLRHAVATVAYRGGKALRGAPPEFSQFFLGEKKTAGEILAHLGDLMDWALSIARGKAAWDPRPARTWEEDRARFHEALTALDAYLASGEPLGAPAAKLMQGPIADALTHVGQINIMRRTAGCPVKSENYYRAPIEVGRVGIDQAPPKVEFD